MVTIPWQEKSTCGFIPEQQVSVPGFFTSLIDLAGMACYLIVLQKLLFMNNRDNNNKEKHSGEPEAKPDKETLNTTDPQEHMKGPVSSTMHGTGKAFETNETKEEADKKMDENV